MQALNHLTYEESCCQHGVQHFCTCPELKCSSMSFGFVTGGFVTLGFVTDVIMKMDCLLYCSFWSK